MLKSNYKALEYICKKTSIIMKTIFQYDGNFINKFIKL